MNNDLRQPDEREQVQSATTASQPSPTPAPPASPDLQVPGSEDRADPPHEFESPASPDLTPALPVCSVCNWTNSPGSVWNLGEPGKPRWVCQGCCKRALERATAAEAELATARELLLECTNQLESAYVSCEQAAGVVPTKSWETAANAVKKYRAALAHGKDATKET